MGRWRAMGIVAVAVGLGWAVWPAGAHDPPERHGEAAVDLDGPRRPSAVAERAMDLRTAEVDFGRLERVVRLTGIVRPRPDGARVVASAVAGTLVQLGVKVGDRVKRGGVIGTVHSVELARSVGELHKTEIELEHTIGEIAITQTNMAQLRNQLQNAQGQAKLLDDEVARLEQGGDTGGVLGGKRVAAMQQRSQVTTLSNSLEQASRTLESMLKIREGTARSIEAMRGQIAVMRGGAEKPGEDGAGPVDGEGSAGVVLLRAPIDGVVTRREGVLGQGVEAGKAIVEVVDPSKVAVQAELPESRLGALAGVGSGTEGRGLAARLRRPGEDVMLAEGRVVGVSPVVDPVRRTANVMIEVENVRLGAGDGAGDGRWWALQDGMFVSVSVLLEVGAGDVVVVPLSAIVEGAVPTVFTKERDGYVRREVVLGARDDQKVEIREGLVPGDVVVVRGGSMLSRMRAAGTGVAGERSSGRSGE